MSPVRWLFPHHERGRLPEAARVSDTERAATAARLQQRCRAWLILWSPWRRTFTAFACFTTEQAIIDEADENAFLRQIVRVELASG